MRPTCLRVRLAACALLLAGWAVAAASQASAPGSQVAADRAAAAARMQVWLTRMHEGSRSRSYVGTFVVSSGSSLSSARIWHVCEGDDQVERVESLSGVPRSVFRHNDQVLTLWPDAGLARSEKRESLGLFLDRLRSADTSLAEHYHLQVPGQVDRVAGVPAEMVQLLPRDRLRFGYRIWLEQQSGLVVKLQTFDAQGQVLEQAAFSELQLGAPLKAEQLLRMMTRLEGYRLEKRQPPRTTLLAEGWEMGQAVPGFKVLSCHKRLAPAANMAGTHCVFSDGLASVSVFLEPVAGKPPGRDSLMAMGATHTLRTQVHRHPATLMGEVPAETLKRFAVALERRKSNP